MLGVAFDKRSRPLHLCGRLLRHTITAQVPSATLIPGSQTARPSTSHPFWVRLVAFSAILLVLFGSFAQAAHVHGDFLPHHEARATAISSASLLAGDEAGCPLCVAMHSACAQQSSSVLTLLVTFAHLGSPARERAVERFLHFSLFSRPPPSGASLPLSASLA